DKEGQMWIKEVDRTVLLADPDGYDALASKSGRGYFSNSDLLAMLLADSAPRSRFVASQGPVQLPGPSVRRMDFSSSNVLDDFRWHSLQPLLDQKRIAAEDTPLPKLGLPKNILVNDFAPLPHLNVVAVPEPTTGGLLLIVAGVLALKRRRGSIQSK